MSQIIIVEILILLIYKLHVRLGQYFTLSFSTASSSTLNTTICLRVEYLIDTAEMTLRLKILISCMLS